MEWVGPQRDGHGPLDKVGIVGQEPVHGGAVHTQAGADELVGRRQRCGLAPGAGEQDDDLGVSAHHGDLVDGFAGVWCVRGGVDVDAGFGAVAQ